MPVLIVANVGTIPASLGGDAPDNTTTSTSSSTNGGGGAGGKRSRARSGTTSASSAAAIAAGGGWGSLWLQTYPSVCGECAAEAAAVGAAVRAAPLVKGQVTVVQVTSAADAEARSQAAAAAAAGLTGFAAAAATAAAAAGAGTGVSAGAGAGVDGGGRRSTGRTRRARATFTIPVEGHDTVDMLRLRIMEYTEILPSDQALYYAGQRLSDPDQTLADAGIHDGAELFVALSLFGHAEDYASTRRDSVVAGGDAGFAGTAFGRSSDPVPASRQAMDDVELGSGLTVECPKCNSQNAIERATCAQCGVMF